MARKTLLAQTTIGAAGTVTTTPIRGIGSAMYLLVLIKFLYGAGGTAVKAYIQTSLDGGTTWIDIMCFAFTTSAITKISKVSGEIALAANVTPGDGALTDNTILDGVIGDMLRVKYVSTGTYTGATSLAVVAQAK